MVVLRNIFPITLLTLVGQGTGKVVERTVKSEHGFGFLGHFAFDHTEDEPSGMSISMELTRPSGLGPADAAYDNMNVYCYDDEDAAGEGKEGFTSWPAVYVKGKPEINLGADVIFSPKGAEGISGHVPNDQIFPMSGADEPPKHINWDKDGKFTFPPKGQPVHTVKEKTRSRTWYCVLGSHDGNKLLPFRAPVSYKLTFLNRGGQLWKQFGVDEQGLNLLYLVYMVAFLILVGLQIYSRTIYKHYHHLPKVLTAAISMQLLSILCFVFHYWTYTFDGEGSPFFKFFGEVFQALSKVVFILMLVLISQGWTILRSEVQARQFIVGLGAIFFVTSMLLVCWSAYPASSSQHEEGFIGFFERDPASTGSIYTTLWGWLLLLVYFGVACIFITTITVTIKETEKLRQIGQRTFMVEMGMFYSVYLVVVPITVLVLNVAIENWAREKWIRTVDVSAQFVAMGAMVFLIWPSRAEKHFGD
jgi:hypothetical protein